MLDRATLETAIRRALAQTSAPHLAGAEPATDIFEALDSFEIVSLLMATEAELENACGRYVPLGDESVLDADGSPLRRLSDWLDFVAEAEARG